MSDQLFKKAVFFTDLHLGKSANDKQHNIDCLNFVRWMIEEATSWGADTFIFGGDWHHSRHNLHVRTMSDSLLALELLAKAFPNIWFIPGNHDLFYKEKRDLSSIEWARNITNINIINEITEVDGVTFCPWLVGDEYKKLEGNKSRYMFGHFELPHFFMNKMVRMPDHGNMNKIEDFEGNEYVFSGHFHKRQSQKNIVYTGNAFPHNYSDAWDNDRGIMLLEWGKDPEFRAWDKAPRYHTMKLSDLLAEPGRYLDDRTYARVELDVDISFDESQVIKETMATEYGVRKLELISTSNIMEAQEFVGDVEFLSVDQLVIEGLRSFEKGSIDPETLVKLYLEL